MDGTGGALALAVMATAVGAAVAAERAGRRGVAVVAKAVASAGFVVVACARFRTGSPYDAWVLVALFACLAGDVILPFRRAFAAGLAAFLGAHVALVVAFATALRPGAWPPVWTVPLVGVSGATAFVLAPRLGRLRAPVLAYIATITVMVWGALAVAAAGRRPWFLAAGAALFYVSDVAVAVDRFVKRAFAWRTWGVPVYYAGQFLLALTVGSGAAPLR